MSFSAILPWPWPSAMDVILSSMPWRSASSRMSLFGSLPVESTKTRGVMFDESSKQSGRSNGGGSVYFWCISLATKSWTPSMSLSRRRHRKIHNDCKLDISWKGAGSFDAWGSIAS